MSTIAGCQSIRAQAVCILVAFLAGCSHSSSGIPTHSSPNEEIRTSNISVAPEFFSLNQNEFAAFKVVVPADATNIRLAGLFSVDPRPYAQLDLVLVREAGYANWRTYPKDGVVYHTGNTSADKVNLSLSAGTYRLIFDNNLPPDSTNSYNSAAAVRTVRSEIRLTYDRHF
jgi:hypothetical protein